MNKKFIFSVLLVCLLVVVVGVAFAQGSPSVRWEYKALYVEGKSMNTILQNANQLGTEGWELVAIDEVSSDCWIFKRRLP